MYNKDKIFQIINEIVKESENISPYVVIAQPRRSQNSPKAQRLQGNNLHIDLMGYSHGYVEITDMPVDSARNYLIEQVLQTDAEYLFFVGDDTISPFNAFKQLLKTSQANPDAVIAGVYYIKLSDPMIMVRKDNHITIADVTPGQVFEAWQTGMDCMLIPVRILRKLYEEDPDLPFCCIASGIPGIPFIGEDNFFVHRLRRSGFKLLVDTNVQCLHMDVYSGKYTAHPDVDLDNYFTQIPITGILTMSDKKRIDSKWLESTNLVTDNYLNQHGS